MQLRWGSDYSWPVNGVRITSGRRVMRDEAGVPYEFTDKVDVEGYVEGSGQQAVSDQMANMVAALAKPFRDLVFSHDDGSNSATCLFNGTSLTGVVITEGPVFPESTGPEWVNQRKFRFTAEADYPAAGRANTLIDWGESIDIDGGGPLYDVLAAIEGPPQRQKIYDQTPCEATQSGFAVGYGPKFPDIPPPIWPFAQIGNPKVAKKSPRKRGKRKYTHYRIEWVYKFKWPLPLVGVPTPWPLN